MALLVVLYPLIAAAIFGTAFLIATVIGRGASRDDAADHSGSLLVLVIVIPVGYTLLHAVWGIAARELAERRRAMPAAIFIMLANVGVAAIINNADDVPLAVFVGTFGLVVLTAALFATERSAP